MIAANSATSQPGRRPRVMVATLIARRCGAPLATRPGPRRCCQPCSEDRLKSTPIGSAAAATGRRTPPEGPAPPPSSPWGAPSRGPPTPAPPAAAPGAAVGLLGGGGKSGPLLPGASPAGLWPTGPAPGGLFWGVLMKPP